MMYIKAVSTISHQATFQQKPFPLEMPALEKDSLPISPNYGAFIPAMERRRMSEVLKMSIACSMDCLEQAGLKQPDAIIVGTGLGCGVNTKTFLDNIYQSNGGLISPTPFILSTHNTIAGQISLLLKNQCYNMTHTQSSLSFEHSLIDARLCLENGACNVLVGAADETEGELYNLNARLGRTDLNVTSGASFFVLSGEDAESQSLALLDFATFGLTRDMPGDTARFLHSNGLAPIDIDLVLYSDSARGTFEALKQLFERQKLFDFQSVSGVYLTNSAFAMGYAAHWLQQTEPPLSQKTNRTILICNNLMPENLGLTLLQKKAVHEAGR